MKKNYKNLTILMFALLCGLTTFAQDFTNGILVLNEGTFGSPAASLSYIDPMGTLENDVFRTQNDGLDLGNTGQGMGFNEESAYIVLNGSNEVKVVDWTTLELVATINEQLSNPRNIAFFEGNGYVTNWGDPVDTEDDYVAIIDLATNTVTGTIPVVEGPEEILQQDGKLYVAHQGGFGSGNSVSVIDVVTNEVERILVGDVPSALQIDDNNLYVLCSGSPGYSGNETTGSLVIVDLEDITNTTEFEFPDLQHPGFLALDATDLYYMLNANIYKMALTDDALPENPFIDTTEENLTTPYGFNKIEDKFYVGDAIDYASDGSVFVYNEDGSFNIEYTVGIMPSAFYNTDEEVLSIDNFTASSSSIAVYPNPATTSFKLNTPESAKVTLYDISGRKVKQVEYEDQAISLEGLNAGIYMVQLEQNGRTQTQKLIVR